MKQKTYRPEADFLPDAQAIRHAALPWWAKHMIWWLGAFFVIAIIWASISEVDVVVTAYGRIVSDHPTIVMKPLDRTIVKGVHVAEGDRVKAGQVLITFDPVFSQADKERLTSERDTLQAQLNRLQAEFDSKPYLLGENPTDEDRVQLAIYQKRQTFYKEKIEYFDREMERIAKSKQTLNAHLDVQKKRLEHLQELEEMMSKGHSAQAVSLRELKDAQLSRMQLEADMGDKQNNMLVLNSEVQSKRAERDAFQSEWRIDIAENIVKVRNELTNTQKALEKATQMTDYVELRAPEDAVVHDMTKVGVGSAVPEAETLLTLTPLGGTLEAEVEIGAEYIGKVRIGDKARIKLTAFPFQQYGTVLGVVRVISKDSFARPNEEKRADNNSAFYRARISLTGVEYASANLLEHLVPGMEVQSEIIVEQRKIMEYLLNPIIKSLDESLREP